MTKFQKKSNSRSNNGFLRILGLLLDDVGSILNRGQKQQLEMGSPKIWDLQSIKFKKVVYLEMAQVVQDQ